MDSILFQNVFFVLIYLIQALTCTTQDSTLLSTGAATSMLPISISSSRPSPDSSTSVGQSSSSSSVSTMVSSTAMPLSPSVSTPSINSPTTSIPIYTSSSMDTSTMSTNRNAASSAPGTQSNSIPSTPATSATLLMSSSISASANAVSPSVSSTGSMPMGTISPTGATNVSPTNSIDGSSQASTGVTNASASPANSLSPIIFSPVSSLITSPVSSTTTSATTTSTTAIQPIRTTIDLTYRYTVDSGSPLQIGVIRDQTSLNSVAVMVKSSFNLDNFDIIVRSAEITTSARSRASSQYGLLTDLRFASPRDNCNEQCIKDAARVPTAANNVQLPGSSGGLVGTTVSLAPVFVSAAQVTSTLPAQEGESSPGKAAQLGMGLGISAIGVLAIIEIVVLYRKFGSASFGRQANYQLPMAPEYELA